MSDALNNYTDCPYWGIGGRYIADPVTGVRVPAPTTPVAPLMPIQPVNPLEENVHV